MPDFAQSLSRSVRAITCVGTVAIAFTLIGWSGAGQGDSGIAALGATLVPQAAPTGLVVTSLRTDGAAARVGLRVGDVIDTVDGRGAPSSAQRLTEATPITLHVMARGDVGPHTLLLRRSEVALREDPDRRGR